MSGTLRFVRSVPVIVPVLLAGCTGKPLVAEHQPPYQEPATPMPYGWHPCPGGFCAPLPPVQAPIYAAPAPRAEARPAPDRPEPAAFKPPPPLRPVDEPGSQSDDSCVGWWRICHFF
jgi:hypothetical protein